MPDTLYTTAMRACREVKRLREAVLSAQWMEDEDGNRFCPWCGAGAGRAHRRWRNRMCPVAYVERGGEK
jgi:hypothetical protein